MMACVKRNFLFLMSGLGKGFFNIFIGTLLFLNHDSAGKTDMFNTIMGSAMIVGGLGFIFLSKVKNMSDEDMNRALSEHS